jgi:hypothetical protein
MPPTPKAEKTAEAEAITVDMETPPELEFSRQAQFSTYKADEEANKLAEEQNPPDGPHVVQELGRAAEGPVRSFEYGGT